MIGAGPSPRPSCAIALYSKATKVTRKLSLETRYNRGQELGERPHLAGRLARETFRIQTE